MDVKKTSVLLILLCSCTLTSPPTYSYYRVKKGENIYDVSEKYNVAVAEIVDLNQLHSGNITGHVLRLPVSKKRSVQSRENQASLRKISIKKYEEYIGNLLWATNEREITSIFGFRPSGMHEGIDLAAPIGTPVYASHSAKVVYSGSGIRGYGKLVVLLSKNIMTVYGHNSKNLVDVGDYVEKGEKIAEVGNTGVSTGPHLHYEIRIRNKKDRFVAVDPLAFYNN